MRKPAARRLALRRLAETSSTGQDHSIADIMAKQLSNPSAHDVARLAGVSQAAVSRAFTPGASVAKATREKVLQAARELGYRPNLLARSLIKGESGIIGLVMGYPRSIFLMSALYALSARLSQAQKHILIYTVEGGQAADPHIEGLLQYRVDALLLMGIGISSKLSAHCRAKGVPVILFNLRSGETQGFASVTVNNREGGRQIAEHLIAQGYRRLGFIGAPEIYRTSREREAGFKEYLAKRGSARFEREDGCYDREDAILAARRLLSRKPRLDAIFCWNDHMALACMEVARYEFGLEVGPELGVAGFGDIDQASWPSFQLTSYSQPVDALIQKVASLILQPPHMQKSAGQFMIDGELKRRASTHRIAT
jgi:DNA-binding LacI/PurR family transcriptional regulator